MFRLPRLALSWFYSVGLLSLLAWQAGRSESWRERSDEVTGVALELRPLWQVIKVGQGPVLSVTLVNRGSAEVTLVEPGDGSCLGRRTPFLEWSYWPYWIVPVCGNINDLKPEEVFALAPGERRRLSSWALVGCPSLSRPGRYRLALRYTNTPDLPWSGLPFQGHDPDAMQRVKGSTRVCAVSNAVEVIVQK